MYTVQNARNLFLEEKKKSLIVNKSNIKYLLL